MSAPEILTRCSQAGLRASVGLKIKLNFQNCQGYIALIPKNYEAFIIVGKLLRKASDPISDLQSPCQPVTDSLCKTKTGAQALRYSTENTKSGDPTITMTDLERFFGGHDHVIITT